MRERHEGKINGVQHELNAHKNHNRVAAHQHANYADREHKCRKPKIVVEFDVHTACFFFLKWHKDKKFERAFA